VHFEAFVFISSQITSFLGLQLSQRGIIFIAMIIKKLTAKREINIAPTSWLLLGSPPFLVRRNWSGKFAAEAFHLYCF